MVWKLSWWDTGEQLEWYAVWGTRKEALSDLHRNLKNEYKRVSAMTRLSPGECQITKEEYVYFGPD